MQKKIKLLRYYNVHIVFIIEEGGGGSFFPNFALFLAAKFGSKTKHSFLQYGKALKYKIAFGFFYDTLQYLP
jgi:hypothetical protein